MIERRTVRVKLLVEALVLVSVALQSAGPRSRRSIAKAVLPRRSSLIATRSPPQRTSSVARARFSAAPVKVAVAVTRRLGPSRLKGIAALPRGARLPLRLIETGLIAGGLTVTGAGPSPRSARSAARMVSSGPSNHGMLNGESARAGWAL